MQPPAPRFILVVMALIAPARPAAADGYRDIADRISRARGALSRGRVAVLQFPYVDGRACDGPRAVQERLTTVLASGGDVHVVDRASLGQVVDEITLGQRGLLDPRASYELGRVLDVDAVLTGTLLELPNRRVQINARLIRIPDGLILAAAASSVKRTWKDPAAASGPLAKWMKSLLGPAADAFHGEEDIDRLIRKDREALESAPERPRRSAAGNVTAGGSLPEVPGSGPRSAWTELETLPSENEGEAPEAARDAVLARGRWLYERDCTHCHGPEGRGVRAMAAVLEVPSRALDLTRKPLQGYTAARLASTLKTGKGGMPQYQKPLTEEDAAALLRYLSRVSGNAAGRAAEAQP